MNHHQKYRSSSLLAIAAFAALLYNPSPAMAAVAPSLGSADSFAVLAGTAVTCTNSTVLGDVGVYPGTAVTQTDCTITGTVHAGNGVAKQAQNDFLSAYSAFQSTVCDQTLTGTLAGVTLTPGVYCFDAAATLTGVLTLDAQGDANAVWIFKIGTLGTGALTGTNFSVVMINGAQACNVYWWVAEAATLTNSSFQGTILAGAAITVTGGTF
ncbi:MAG: ice-binding family protein, partial [Nitrospiria bacterium]